MQSYGWCCHRVRLPGLTVWCHGLALRLVPGSDSVSNFQSANNNFRCKISPDMAQIWLDFLLPCSGRRAGRGKRAAEQMSKYQYLTMYCVQATQQVPRECLKRRDCTGQAAPDCRRAVRSSFPAGMTRYLKAL